jgi:D-alanyl-D-alanine carboxypeptidase/D-alanyl-D-alanine-endopeptidase (penicillin-binding protein 4)
MGRKTHLRTAYGPSSRSAFCLLTAVLALALAAATAEPARAARPTLPARLAAALAVPGLDHSRSAALAVDLRTGRVVFARNPTLSLVPASNEKIAVAYAALALLGPAYRFHTDVVGRGALAGGVWSGDLFLKGYGDPTLTLKDVDALAARVAARGIRHVTGAVVGDETWFDSRRTGPGWRSRFYINESPPLSALTVARATYRGKTAPKPALAAAALLRQALAAHGVLVARPARLGKLPQQGSALLATDASTPLAAIVRYMGRESDNHTAELLLKHLGALELGLGTTAAGARVVRTYLAAAEVPLGGVRVADGSGLSNLDRLTATAVVALLQAGAANPGIRDAFLGSLAVAGVDGTLRRRLVTAPARGRVIAKTGTTRLACALSGFVRDRYVFAVIHNGSPVATWAARKAQDRFATALARVA